MRISSALAIVAIATVVGLAAFAYLARQAVTTESVSVQRMLDEFSALRDTLGPAEPSVDRVATPIPSAP